MKKYIVSILIVVVFLAGAPFVDQKALAANMSITEFINLLITIGVIPANKVSTAKSFLLKINNTSTVTSVVPACAAVFNRDLDIGSSGADVINLQNFLVKHGYANGTATGYFGALTQQTVAIFQKENGISPAAGFVGVLTRDRMNKVNCGAVTIPIATSSNMVGTNGTGNVVNTSNNTQTTQITQTTNTNTDTGTVSVGISVSGTGNNNQTANTSVTVIPTPNIPAVTSPVNTNGGNSVPSENLNLGTISVRAIVANVDEVSSKYGSYGIKFTSAKLTELDQALGRLNTFVGQSSYGKTQLLWKTSGVYELGNGVCNHASYGDKVDDLIQRALQAEDSKEPLPDYSYYVIVHPMPSCSDGVQWSIEGRGQFVAYSLNGRTVHLRGIHTSVLDDRYLFHEFGHSLGYKSDGLIGHPSYLNCPISMSNSETNITLSNSCPFIFDFSTDKVPAFTIMSSRRGFLSDFSAVEKEIIGWLTGSDIVTTTSGNYTLSPLEQTGSGPKALKISIPGTYYTAYVSFRQPIGYTYPATASGKPNGIVIDIANGLSLYFLVTNSTNLDAPLQIGMPYRLGVNGPAVTVNSISNNSASITVSN